MNAVVVAENVRRSYGDTVALSGVSLSVGHGEVFALIGPNGAGKTTLVRALTGTTVPNSGFTTVLGDSPTDVSRDRLGVLPQDFAPPARLTARELLEYYAGLYENGRDPETVLADVGLVDSGETWYENLSGGQQRRICVGSALVNDPEVLFLDEPTTGIDPAGRRTVWRLVEELAASGTTVFLTTHDMAEAEHLADRVGLLADGELVACGTPDDLIAEHGGSSRLTVETTAPIDAFDDLVYSIEPSPEGIVVRDVSTTQIGDVVDALDDRGITYTGLTWAEPDLEDVYLSLAGETERYRTRMVESGNESALEGGDLMGDGLGGDNPSGDRFESDNPTGDETDGRQFARDGGDGR